MRNGINCKLVSDNLSAFMDKELDNDFSSEIKKHLCECFECRKKFSKLLKLHYLLKKYFDGETYSDYKENLLNNIRFINKFDFVTQK